MRKETQLGLVAAAIVGALVGCCALLVVLASGPARDNRQEERPAEPVAVRPVADPEPPQPKPLRAQAPAVSPAEEFIRPAPPPPDLPRVAMPRLEPPRLLPTERERAKEPAPNPVPEFNAFLRAAERGRIRNPRQSAEVEPIEIIRAFLTDQLASGEALKIQIYSDPARVAFQRKKAVVLRVLYEIRSPAKTTPKDQLFVVQDREVKQWVDFEPWLAQVRKALQALAEQQRQALAAYAAQQRALAAQLAQRPGNC